MDATYLLKKLKEHNLHYGEQERAAEVVQTMLDELKWVYERHGYKSTAGVLGSLVSPMRPVITAESKET